MPPRHEFVEIVNVPYRDAPKLPASPRKPARLSPVEPHRPLGRPGREQWDRVWRSSTTPPNVDLLLQLCEQVDERAQLRVRVISGEGDFHDRSALRVLDRQISDALVLLADAQQDAAPSRWPTATKRWWRAVSRLPHCVLWTEADWQFAMDTACLVAAFHAGDHRHAQEIRRREAIMGTTADARRDLRIRYVEPEPEEQLTRNPSVTAIEDYRRSVNA